MQELNWRGRAHLAAQNFVRSLRPSGISFERPVFIWGPGQSGTFILYDLVASFGGFAYHTARTRKKGLAQTPIGAKLFRNGFPHEGKVRFWTTRDADEVRSRYAHISTGRRILDKCPDYILMVQDIEDVFPDALHIYCKRDREKVAASMVNRLRGPITGEETNVGYPSGWYGDLFLDGHEALTNTSPMDRHLWLVDRLYEIGDAAAASLGDRCLVSHHEALLRDPKDALRRISDFIGVDVPGNIDEIIASGIRINGRPS